MSGPILLGGLSHTGKTQLRLALDTIPTVSFTRRTYLWEKIYRRFGDLSETGNLDRCFAAIAGIEGTRALHVNLSELRARFTTGPPTYPRLIRLFHEQVARDRGRARWGDQMGSIELYAPIILHEYPDARMIHMIRDPRAMHAARRTSSRFTAGALGRDTARWLSSAKAGSANQKHFPDRYLMISYEELAGDPSGTLRTVADFIQEPVPSEAFSIINDVRFDEAGPAPPEGAINAARVLSEPANRFVYQYAMPTMRSRGYLIDPEPLTPVEKAQFALGVWPTNRISMLTWERLNRRRQYV